MTTLPRLYARFLPLFAKMDLPLRTALEGMLTAFAKVPPPYTRDQKQPEGEFIGFDGIENRGRLANLLESEWLLRELDPDDFVRRVSEGEVMFRRRDFKGTGTKDVLTVVLDCGPWMLGRNRIVALAALFYLALRADRMGARLLWTVPGKSKGWSEDLTPDTIRTFLGRVVQGPLPAQALDDALAQLDEGPRECWYVGAQTASDHPDISGSIILTTAYGTDDAEVLITSRGRRSRITLELPNDADTVAALRRPFVPERKPHAKVVADVGELTAEPFHRDWLLDRFNQAVLIRYPNGVLWQPLKPGRESLWVAFPKDKTLLGMQPQVNDQMRILLGIGGTDVELITVDIQRREIGRRHKGWLPAEIGKQPQNAMGNLHAASGNKCILVTADGTALGPGFENVTPEPSTEDRVVFCNGAYIIEQTNNALRVRNPKRGTLARVNLPPDCKDLQEAPRRMVFSPDTKAITFTTDDHSYTAISGLDLHSFELENMTLLHFHSVDKALAWDPTDNSVVNFMLYRDEVRSRTINPCKTPITGTPRYCPLTTTIFAMNTNEAGEPQSFVPIETPRGWQDVEAFDIPEAVEKAQTLWL